MGHPRAIKINITDPPQEFIARYIQPVKKGRSIFEYVPRRK
jgi:hypothetical protein